MMLGLCDRDGLGSVITPHRVSDALVFVVGSGGAKMGLPLFGTQLQN